MRSVRAGSPKPRNQFGTTEAMGHINQCWKTCYSAQHTHTHPKMHLRSGIAARNRLHMACKPTVGASAVAAHLATAACDLGGSQMTRNRCEPPPLHLSGKAGANLLGHFRPWQISIGLAWRDTTTCGRGASPLHSGDVTSMARARAAAMRRPARIWANGHVKHALRQPMLHRVNIRMRRAQPPSVETRRGEMTLYI